MENQEQAAKQAYSKMAQLCSRSEQCSADIRKKLIAFELVSEVVDEIIAIGNDLYAGGEFITAGGVTVNHIAKRDGTSWSPLGSGVNGGVPALTFFNGELYAGGQFTLAGGVSVNYVAKYGCDLSTSVSEISSPINSRLEQNYPNPFNSNSTIRYFVTKKSFIKLSVFNLFGKEVKVLVNEEQNPGQYEVIFDGKEFVSGIYIYNLKTDEASLTKNMILIK